MPLFAADLQVAPTLVTIAPQRAADGLMLRNSGERPLIAQVRVFAWTQDAGEDRLTETEDLAVSPPMIEIAPGAEQLVRVVRRIDAPDAIEGSYRVIVDELPDPTRPVADDMGLNFVFRYSIPVFLEPVQPATSVLHARLVDVAEGRALEVENLGTARAQIADIVHVDPALRQQIAPGLAGYVLPGRQRRWPLPPGAKPGHATDIQARINGEPDARTLLPDR
ncbi:fimbrial biogenesis chaperone [Luteimonas abyssi]|uniref:fimbrial biogenesis chaperone n=1 Tax=Luteimonas abyssi TaxID=1247514 RepID=UPI000A595026|nr:molecular chaperone [Luteimonas abyssi]